VGEHFPGDLRRALLEAAVATLDERGADGLSLREVARRAGVSHAAPAHHFNDKAGLLTAVATEGFGMLVTYLAAARPGGAGQPADQLAALGRAYAQFAEQNPGRFEVMFRPGLVRADDPALQQAGDAAFGVLRQHIAACQRRGWREREPADALAGAAWALAHGIAVLRMQGSLARHYPDPSLSGVGQLVTALTAGDGGVVRAALGSDGRGGAGLLSGAGAGAEGGGDDPVGGGRGGGVPPVGRQPL
jgi:AcrR family transcriptional regulator